MTLVADAAKPLLAAGRPVIVVASPTVRAPLRQILHPHLAGVVVLGYNELVDGFDVQSVGLVQLGSPEPIASSSPVEVEQAATPGASPVGMN